MKTIACNNTCFGKSIVYALITLCSLGLFSCSDDGDSDNSATKSIKLQKLDLSNAKYLTINREEGRAGTESEVGLFKIDSEGNMSTVVLTCTEEKDGSVTKTLTNIRVIPMEIISLSGIYTLMQRCDFKDETNNFIDMQQYYEPNVYAFNILVRNADGKIFYIPDAASKYFSGFNNGLDQPTTDDKGNLYLISNDDNLGILTIINDELVIKQVNPNNVHIAGEITPTKNGTILVSNYNTGDGTYTFLYPDGGFETLTPFDKGQIYLSNTPSGIKAIQVKELFEYNSIKEYILYFHDYTVGTSTGKNSLSQPIASISSGTDFSINLGDANYVDWVSKYRYNRAWISSVYETSNSFILGRCLVVNKQTYQITALNWEESNSVIIPTRKNIYKGRSWEVDLEGASWYNVETLKGGYIPFNLPEIGNVQNLEISSNNIPNGEVTIQGVRNSDGKQIIYTVNIETGNATTTVNESNRPIVTLIPLN